MISFPPGLILIIGAFILLLVPRRLRTIAFLLFPSISLIWLICIRDLNDFTLEFLGYQLVLTHVDELSLCFGYVFIIITFLGGIYSLHVKDPLEPVFTLLYAGSSLGAVFAGDIITLFIFFELMAISSVYLIWARRTSYSSGAGMRYLIIHLLGGVLLISGILLHIQETNSIQFQHFNGNLSSYLILTSFCINAAMPPVHAWLSDAYPEGTVTGSVFLSAFTTKTAVYALARGFSGWEFLAWSGAIMAVYGVFYAFLQNDIRRILAYHIISQVGYMICGIGIGTALAINGAVAHAFTHILYKALLFMSTGAVLYTTGFSKLTQLGGLFKQNKTVFYLFIIGALSISGVPLFSGFISKSMVVYASEIEHLDVIFVLLNIASVGTFLSITMKLAYFTWFNKPANNTEYHTVPVPKGMYIGMGLTAFLCIFIGVFPQTLYNILPLTATYQPYTFYHIVNTCILFIFTGTTFWLLKNKLISKAEIILDTDWFYRKPAKLYYKVFIYLPSLIFRYCENISVNFVHSLVVFIKNPIFYFHLAGSKLRGSANPTTAEYNPDKYRLPIGYLIFIVIALFVILLLIGITHI